MTSQSSIFKNISLWTVSVIGIVILFWICSLLLESRSALKWPQTEGRVLSSTLFINHLPRFMDLNADPMRWYGADVEYEYSVNGSTYYSKRLSFDTWGTRSAKAALKVMNMYRHHPKVTVYYDPSDPLQSVLEPANIGDILLPLVIEGILLFVALIYFYESSLLFKVPELEDYIRWGKIYQKQGKFDEALKEFNKSIHLSPSLVQGYKSRGELFFQLGYWDEAIIDLDRALEIDPIDASLYYSRANAYLGKKQCDRAWEDMQKAIGMGMKVRPQILEEIRRGLSGANDHII